MKHLWVCLIAFTLVLVCGCDKGPSGVIVKSITYEVPVGTNAYELELAFREFVGKHQDQEEWDKEWHVANSISGSNWKAKYAKYSRALLAKSAEAQLDSQSLSNVLRAILVDAESQHLACVPFAAYRAKFNGEPAWVIDLSWEYEGIGSLSHIRSLAITANDLKQVGFSTCR